MLALALTEAVLQFGGMLAGYQSYQQGKGFWRGYSRYINDNWAQSVAISMALFVVSLGVRAATQAIANANRKAALANAAKSTTLGNGLGNVEPAKLVRLISRGEKLDDIFNEMKSLTMLSGNEHALVKLSHGSRALVSGGQTGISFSNMPIKLLYAHTHPYHLLATGPSMADIAALQALGQRSSYLLEQGSLIKFFVR